MKGALGQSREVEATVRVHQYFGLRQDIPLPRKRDLEYATTSHALMEHYTELMLPWNDDPLICQADFPSVWGKRWGQRLCVVLCKLMLSRIGTPHAFLFCGCRHQRHHPQKPQGLHTCLSRSEKWGRTCESEWQRAVSPWDSLFVKIRASFWKSPWARNILLWKKTDSQIALSYAKWQCNQRCS